MEIKVLAHRGIGIRETSKQMGCSHNTVRPYLREAPTQQYGPWEAKPTKLDPYKNYVRGRVEAARPHWIPAVVLLQEIQEQGYLGSLTQLRVFINGLRAQPTDAPVVRFETPAGRSKLWTALAWRAAR